MRLLSGNDAVAVGAHSASATVGVGYPGTPSTEALEHFAKFDDVYAEWCANEKVALEVALGASAAGARCLVTMKHVGLNVAADPLFTSAYTGVGGGLVVLAADDPGMHSSQNEQDSRYYGAAAHIPVLEPSDSQEAYDFAKLAYELSEKFDVPVIIRSTVRISHTQTPVAESADLEFERKPYEKAQDKWVMMPLYAKARRIRQLARIDELTKFANESDLNREELRFSDIGIVCSGAVYEHVREALPDASTLKLGIAYPICGEKIKSFASKVDKLYVIEEASTYLREAVKACGVDVDDTPCPIQGFGELSPVLIRDAFGFSDSPHESVHLSLPARPPALCPGCPHRLVFKELSRIKAIVVGDIGCYTLGALAPLDAMDSCVDMGASISMAHGMELALNGSEHRPVVGIIGDSTFAHSGISSLMTIAYNNGAGVICILDNRTTAMTGRQGNPFNGQSLQGRPCTELDIAEVVRSLGVEHVQVVDPYDMRAVRSALGEAVSEEKRLSVLVFKRPCVLLERSLDTPYFVSNCIGCGVCITLGCSAIGKDAETGLAYIDQDMCIGCGQCAQYCHIGAIAR